MFAPGEGAFDTLSVGELSKEQVDGLIDGTWRLYVLAWGRWKGAEEDFDLCEWFQPLKAADLRKAELTPHYCAQ